MKAEMWNISGWAPLVHYSDAEIVEINSSILTASGFAILKYVDHKFSPWGFTALWLLAESHYAIHTFPEEDKYYWELSSCVKEYYDRFCSLKYKILNPSPSLC